MPDKLQQTAAPATTPVSRDEAKAHLNIASTDTTWDTFIDTLLQSATDYAEERTRKAVITQTWIRYLNAFPSSIIEIPKPPLQSVSSITYIDTAGDVQTWAAANYDVDIRSEPGTVNVKTDFSYPSTKVIPNAVVITFVAGYGTAGSDAPALLISTIKLIIAHLFDNREMVSTMGTPAQIPFPNGIERLLDQYSLREFV